MCADYWDYKEESIKLFKKIFDLPEILDKMEEGEFDDALDIAKNKLYENIDDHDLQKLIIALSEAIKIQDLNARMYTHTQD